MALATYRARVTRLLQAPAAPTALYPTADIDSWVNQARGQVAGDGEAIRAIGTISTVVSQRPYAFTSISTGVAATTGIAGVTNVRRITRTSGSGQVMLVGRAWEWFDLYHMNNAAPVNGAPTVWAQYQQGAGFAATSITSVGGGSFYLDPPPDAIYTLNCDCQVYPIDLVDDTTKEALPGFWVDAVGYFAAYLALLSAQTSARMADAQRMMQLYDTFMSKARQFSNPSVLRGQFEQAQDPTIVAKLGLQQRAGGQQ